MPRWERGIEGARLTHPYDAPLTMLGLGRSVGTGPAGLEAEVLAVRDWEMATVGDPLTDLGLFLMFWGDKRSAQPPGFAHVQAVTRAPDVHSRRALAER